MADKKLEKVRAEFIRRVNKSIISQLLDDLLRKRIMDDEELEEVHVKHKTQDQARILIDNVRKKGPEASALFICILLARNTYLAEQLDLQKPLIVGQPTEVKISVAEESKNGIRLCPQNVFQQIQTSEGTEVYPINDPKIRTRLALIICNIKFDHLNDRQGAEVDLEQMKLLLEDLGYNVKIECDLNSQDITTCLKNFAAQKEHKASDGMFVVLMSHGYKDSLCGVHSEDKDSDIFSIPTVFSTFNNINCPDLRGKPKVVIIQACRGEQRGYMVENVEDSAASAAASVQCESHVTMQMRPDATQRVHVESHVSSQYSTTPEQRGYMEENVEDSAASAAASLQCESHATVQLQTDSSQRVHVESHLRSLFSTTPEQRGYMEENVEGSAASAAASLQYESYVTMELQTDAIKRVHIESDFISLYSTTPDHVSWRHPKTGSLFINQLIDTIKKHAWNCNLEEVFRKVLQHFAHNPCQMPSKDRTTLTKKFYLFPGH